VRGFKIHCHVQKLASDDPRLDPLYERARAAGVPVVIHSGRAPVSGGYGVDVAKLCSVAATRRALERHPELTLVVPHLGSDEVAEHLALLDQFPNLHLDTTMVLADFFSPPVLSAAELERRADRILYGTDFPNLPYDWDRELRWLEAQPLSASAREAILSKNALRLFT
jgi:predicted TIM-barrel fold metal-dependent hydrolase